MSEWQERTLGGVCQFRAGSAFPQAYQGEATGDYPFVKVSDMALSENAFRIVTAQNWLSEQARKALRAKKHPEGATVFAKIGVALTYNRRRLLSRTCLLDNNMMSATPDQGQVTPDYLFYLLSTLDFNEIAAGTALPYLRAGDLAEIAVRLPDLDAQRSTAAILRALDDKIELNRRMNRTLEAIARAIFKSWFVDFDPVHAKAEGREPVGMDPETAALFPDSFQDSPLGKIPVGWTAAALSDLTSHLKRGISPAYVNGGGICVLNQKCIRGRRVDFAAARRHDPERKSVEGRTLEALDILVNSTGVGTLGRVAQLWDLPETAVADSHITVVRAGKHVDSWFLGTALVSREKEIEALGEGTTGQTELSRAVLGELPCVVPPVAAQRAFGHFVAPLLLRIAANQREARALAAQRDTLLPKLISGELTGKGGAHIVLEANV